ncbi:uncharacterized protein APUU_50061S [Aspergillus puulaauensis]|uniref:aldehyde dehydrogenase (NAD(+)) n=1 Tax=Aspergillus puulaauensis TaxID=1220207 RepID=A0A7R7XPN2_9EURO|nr:uncharacterized protein APUU_50061S [Aspergillus puulaauensis]BCS25350.1 hypothetical protein APUU_50061S [Aspergillus puulaauensis]
MSLFGNNELVTGSGSTITVLNPASNPQLLATINTLEDGRPFSAALEEDLERSYQVFKYHGGATNKISGDTIEASPAKLAYVLHKLLDIRSQIIPRNYPFTILARKIAPAPGCGNTVVIKPAG